MISDFSAALRRANSLSCEAITLHLRAAGIRGITEVVERPSVADDRAGIDYIAHRYDSAPLNIDLKEISYTPTCGETPDVLLETARVGKRRAPGWATDSAKKTDLFLFVWGDDSSAVFWAREVRAALAKYGGDWCKIYRTGRAATRGYHETFHSEFIVVPQAILRAACAEIAENWVTDEDRGTIIEESRDCVVMN